MQRFPYAPRLILKDIWYHFISALLKILSWVSGEERLHVELPLMVLDELFEFVHHALLVFVVRSPSQSGRKIVQFEREPNPVVGRCEIKVFELKTHLYNSDHQ